jgi:hypothetical protein
MLTGEEEVTTSEARGEVLGDYSPVVTLFTISEAAQRCGVSTRKIRRLVESGAFPDARQDEGAARTARVWRIPVPDLLAAGLVPNRDPFAVSDPGGGAEIESRDSQGDAAAKVYADSAEIIDRLRRENDALRSEKQILESNLLDLRLNVSDLRSAILLLEAGRLEAESAPESQVQLPQAEEENGLDRLSEIPISGPRPALVENTEKSAQRRGFWGWVRDL